MHRHKGIKCEKVQEKLEKKTAKLKVLLRMEESGGEPDVIGFDKKSNEFIFFDCAKESSKERRSVCYDQKALDSRKQHKPKDSALGMAKKIGTEILSEEDYRLLQKLEEFDLKTSSWLETPNEIRKLGGAIFGDRRYDHVFIYHNGAESYYGARGFRCRITV